MFPMKFSRQDKMQMVSRKMENTFSPWKDVHISEETWAMLAFVQSFLTHPKCNKPFGSNAPFQLRFLPGRHHYSLKAWPPHSLF